MSCVRNVDERSTEPCNLHASVSLWFSIRKKRQINSDVNVSQSLFIETLAKSFFQSSSVTVPPTWTTHMDPYRAPAACHLHEWPIITRYMHWNSCPPTECVFRRYRSSIWQVIIVSCCSMLPFGLVQLTDSPRIRSRRESTAILYGKLHRWSLTLTSLRARILAPQYPTRYLLRLPEILPFEELCQATIVWFIQQ
jgi:hypothetical protein